MNSSPRSSYRLTFIISLALVCSFVSLPAAAQQQRRGRNRAQQNAKAQAEDAAARARRAKALTLLTETAEEARAIPDLFYRARLQALAADALYPFDRERARQIFRRAWEAATASDTAEQEEEDAQSTGSTVDAAAPVTQARDETLAKTAARDAALADVFLRELLKDKKSEINPDENENESERASVWREPGASSARRIALGLELLESGEAASAFKMVAPVVNEGVSASLVVFLLRLREHDAAAGEALYRLMIAQMSRDATADANTLLLLSTPIVSPQLMVAINAHGSVQFRPLFRQGTPALEPQPFSQATRNGFFKAAAFVLLRPAPPARPGASREQDKNALFFAIGRLLPFFEREAAQHVPELRARSLALYGELTESQRAPLSSQMSARAVGFQPSTDALRSHFEERERATDQQERDRITVRIVLIAARTRAWDRARRAAAELSDEGWRRAANSFIAVNQIADLARAYADEKEDDYESILSFLNGVDVPPLAAAWGYAQAAEVAARKKDMQRVNELLTEAESYAGRVEASAGSQRVAAYGLITQSAARLNQQRAWEMLTQLVKAANAASDDYAGDEAAIELQTEDNPLTATETPFTFTTAAFRLENIFATMARLDFERAVASARALEGKTPRVFAQLAIARDALERAEKK
jgi:hypothetical protein